MLMYKISKSISSRSDSEPMKFQKLTCGVLMKWEPRTPATHFYTEVLVALSPRAGSHSDRRMLALCSCGC